MRDDYLTARAPPNNSLLPTGEQAMADVPEPRYADKLHAAAMLSLADIIELQTQLAARDERIAELEKERDNWQESARLKDAALYLCMEELEFDAANVNYGGEKRIVVDRALSIARAARERKETT